MAEAGRKLFDGKDELAVIQKLEEVFAIGGTDLEACLYADISKTSLYNYQQDHPEFVERKEKLKERPILKARQTVVKALDNPLDAKWYLEKKRKKEFGNTMDVTSDGEKIAFLPSEIINKHKLNDSPSSPEPNRQG